LRDCFGSRARIPVNPKCSLHPAHHGEIAARGWRQEEHDFFADAKMRDA